MSTIISATCWKLQGLSPTEKLVLISLADQANDDGVCWPSVNHTIDRTCLSERAVRKCIKSLEDVGLLQRMERAGRSTYYTVTPARYAPLHDMQDCMARTHPCTTCTPPLHDMHTTPARHAPITVIETSVEPQLNLQIAPPAAAGGATGPKDPSATTYETWNAYSSAFADRYGAFPIWNQQVAGMIANLVKRIGADNAPRVARFYVGLNSAYYVRQQHTVKPLLADCEAIYNQWVTGRTMTSTKARQVDQTAANLSAIDEGIALLRKREAQKAQEHQP